jgi:hypothetical protein
MASRTALRTLSRASIRSSLPSVAARSSIVAAARAFSVSPLRSAALECESLSLTHARCSFYWALDGPCEREATSRRGSSFETCTLSFAFALAADSDLVSALSAELKYEKEAAQEASPEEKELTPASLAKSLKSEGWEVSLSDSFHLAFPMPVRGG